MIQVTDYIAIEDSEIELRFVRASGPGGQNVNKVSSAVQLRFHVTASPNLPPAVKARLVALAGQRLTTEGVLIINAREHRSQELNRQAALARLVALIRLATEVPKERRPTRPSRGAKAARMDDKRQQGARKQARRTVRRDDW